LAGNKQNHQVIRGGWFPISLSQTGITGHKSSLQHCKALASTIIRMLQSPASALSTKQKKNIPLGKEQRAGHRDWTACMKLVIRWWQVSPQFSPSIFHMYVLLCQTHPNTETNTIWQSLHRLNWYKHLSGRNMPFLSGIWSVLWVINHFRFN